MAGALPDPAMAGAPPYLAMAGAPPGQIPPTPGQIPAPRPAMALAGRRPAPRQTFSDPTTVGRQEASSSSICLDLSSDLL
jgi:hypothetical protein